ncbi:msx2-interacting protein isoform X1 [Morone saxatilis]|uniref:msx2-interacting protein isoform X1 n=2 Tax=Morone saxatilis TaxID=34816 RepID=UPI0015E21493|nr:msx2-interacting protein isoform X1 [Morone saxatilis]
MVRETRHLWVGNLPEHVREEKIVEHFKRYGRVESVKVLRKRGSEGGVAAFVDFVDIKSAQKAHNAVNKMGDRDLRTDYNEPGSVPSAVRGLEDSSPSSSRDVTGFSRGTVGPVFGPSVSLHTREGRYERRIDGSSESRERAYDHSPYGHHDRSGTFDRQRHYNADYYRDRSMFAAAGPGSSAIGGSFEASDPHFDSRIRDPFTLTNSTRRDLYRDDRGRRVDRTYHHRRSRSSHSSQSRHPSPQRTTGQTPKTPHSPKRAPLSPGRGPRSRSRSRSSSSDSVSSTSSTGSGSDSNSSSSDGSRARSVQSSATHAPTQSSMVLDSEEPRRSFGIKVQNLPVRSTDTSLKDGLFHEFKKHGKVTSVQIHGASEDRYGLVFFRQQEDQEKALTVSKGKLFFGMLIEVTAWNGPETESENEFRPLDGRIDEFHPKATRTLFIGNLEKTTSYQQLLDIFQRFGEIVDIDIKKVNGVPQYAFVQYSDIASVCKAIKKMDGEYLGSNRLKLGFGKSMPTTCVWLDGLATSITEQYLTRHFCRYGHVVKVVFDRLKGMALVLYNNTDFAQAAVRETKGWKIGGNKIKVDFASQESQMAFYRSMQASGQERDFYEIPPERREERRPPYHEFTAERAYYENIRTPGLYPEDARRDYAARSRDRFPELEHYQGDHFDPRYHEDPREYRDYRDPFEQDIRKYTYIQRERERERERFEADRSRWSPSHPRRPVTPTVSPSPSERAPRDPERRVYSQSSERSGSVSSMSPPHFDKSEKTLPEHASKSDKSEKSSQPDRVAGAEKTKRAKRKEKGDKDKADKIKSRKAKGQSPSNPLPEAELETGFDGGSGRGKGSDQDAHERQKCKADGDSLAGNQLSTAHHDPVKSERSEMSKGENSDMEGKSRLKKHLKSDIGNDGKDSSMDSDRLAARKRRFADSSGRTIRQKRSRHEGEDGTQTSDLSASATYLKESDTDKQKDSQRRDSRLKTDKSGAQKDGQEDLRGQREKSEGSLDPLESKRHPGHASSRRFSHEGLTEQSSIREHEHLPAFKFGTSVDTDKSAKTKEDHVDIDLSQSYRKQMEQNRRLHQQQQQRESDKPDKPGSPQGSETEDLEHRSLVHEVGKPPEDVTDNFPSHKLKKLDQFDTDSVIKRERVYRSFRQKSEEPDWNNTSSPGHQHFSHLADVDFVDHSQKELSRNEEKIHPDLELLVKRTHNTQVNKPNTPILSVEEEQQKRWESRVKQDLLPDLNFSRSLSKNIHKRLEYGIWHDLEPGEVRSDPEEDRETKPHSPVPSTSMPFPERPRVDRFSDPKLAHLERNKFYSFALDQTITPDTKALLERAKSLSSSREDNWSFLDYDSHFASFRNRKDTEKVESAPRPTPSWYMKKKKIRSGSEDKLDDRKEEPKPEEHERRELFASRFLHSPVFELDSKRLQHLERKHEEPEHTQNQLPGQQGAVDGELDSGPVVLFHSRFLELTRLEQQKNKTQQLEEVKGDALLTDENKVEKAPDQEKQALQSPETTDSIVEPEIKPISPADELISEPRLTPTSVTQSVVKDFPSLEERGIALNPVPDPPPPVSFIKEVVKEQVKENEPVEPVHHPPTETLSDPETAPIAAPEPSYSVDRCKLSPSEGKLAVVTEDVKPLSTERPCRRDSQDEFVSISEAELDPEATQPEVPEATSPIPPSLEEEVDIDKKETHFTCKAVAESEGEKKLQVSKVQLPIDDDTNDEPVSPQKEHKTKEMKNKKFKQSPAQVTPVPVMSTPGSEKQATRKSERIDKEKLKRGSSPRAESKSTSKSPSHGSDPDMFEQSISISRARRRNVKSVYATPVEEDAPVRSAKEMSPRSARKRGTDKEHTTQQLNIEQDPPAPTPANKRGRPPKNRRQGDESSTVKVEKSKMDNKDTDSNESESGERLPRLSKGKTSPHGTKSSSNQMSTVLGHGSSRKGEKAEEDDQEMDFTDEDSLALQDSSSSCKEDPLIKADQKKEDKDKQGRELGRDKDVLEKACEGKSNGKETDSPVLEEKSTLEKDRTVRGKAKFPRTPKSPVLKNLKIRLNVTEVKDLLQLGDDELGNQDDFSKKLRPGEHSDDVSTCTNANRGGSNNEETENSTLEKKDLLEAPKSLISQELELEQAVENIAKLTDPAFPAEPTTPPVPPAEVKSDLEEEKPSNPASETELIAAIDSITAEEATVSLTQPPPPSVEAGSESETQDFIQPPKEGEPETTAPAIQEEAVFPTTPKKGTKGRPKTPKRSKGQKQVRKDLKEGHSVSEESTSSSADGTASSVKIIPETTPSAATAAVITPTTNTWKPESEPSAVIATDIIAESESSSEEHIQHLKSINPQSKSSICLKPQQVPPECISPSQSPLANRPNMRPIQPTHQTVRIPVSPPDWRHQCKDTGVSSSPVMPLASKENQPLPSESENMDIDHGTSDLRQILMKHKNMSLPGSSSVPSNLLTLRDQNPSESNTPSAVVPNKSPLPDSRMPAHPVPPIVRPPTSLPSPETKSVISVIASTGTSVISRVCNPPEPEINMNIVNPCVDMALPKPTYRPSKDDTGSYHGQSVGDEGGSAARFIVESPTLGTGSCPGLRVNTSEGVVVLSHSGQKTEGPQRISAKISQIPQATAGDMESQQLVSMPQIKPDMYGHSHSGLQKGPSSQTDHGHPGKMQSAASIKQESTVLEKMESAYQSGPQGVVKRLTQGNQQVMSYHQEYMPIKHQKKIDSADPHSTDGTKPPWTSAISPAISPHLPSPPGNHVGFVTAAGDRAPSHISVKQEPRSPRKSGHPHSPFTKVSSPIGSSSPKGIPVMLPTGLPAMQQFITGVHHPEQSVIMPPHSVPGGLGRMSPHRVTQSIPVGHLVQGDVRVNTPPLSVMSYGMHSEPLASPWSGPMQPRPTSPQAVGREKVLKVNPGSLRGHEGEQEETRRFHQMPGRQSAAPLKPESMQSDPCGPLRGNAQLGTYMKQRDMLVLLQQQGERLATDPHSGHIQETLPTSSAPSNLPLSLSPRAHVLPKGVSEKDITKPLEAKRPHSPLSKDGMMGIRQSGQAMASPQRVQLITPGPSGSFPEYSGMYSNPRGVHPQIPETSPVGLNQPPLSVTPTMGADLQTKPDGKMTQPVNMVQLLTKYPIVWQGLLALKNDTAAVQLHFVCGNKALAHRSLPLQEGGALLRIVQRMRLEASQLDSVARRMTGDSDFCLLLALPCGRDQDDVLNQTQALKAAFINYLQTKLAAGIINIPNPGSNQPAYVLQIFPPCEFSESHLSQLAPDLLNRISSISPHLMIVITSV